MMKWTLLVWFDLVTINILMVFGFFGCDDGGPVFALIDIPFAIVRRRPTDEKYPLNEPIQFHQTGTIE